MNVELRDGVTVFVEELGSGFPLIVLHGGPGLDHTMFRPYLDPLANEFRLLYVDERGQGQSDRVDPATLSLDVFARDVDLLAEALGLERFALLGHSFGALITNEARDRARNGGGVRHLGRRRFEREPDGRRRGLEAPETYLEAVRMFLRGVAR